jgi:positive regulator of sigma E activity
MFLTAPLAGYFLGKWISQALHLPAALAWIGAALGLAAAFVHLVRLSARVSR